MFLDMIRSDKAIAVNTHEAKTELSRLLRAVEQDDVVVTICRNGQPVAQLRRIQPSTRRLRKLTPIDPKLRVRISASYDPLAGIPEDHWPQR